jgi:hypothetical protein
MMFSLRRVTFPAAFLCMLGSAALAEDPVDVGTLAGYATSRPRDISNHGDLVGQAVRFGLEPGEQAALWTRTPDGYAVEALPALPGMLRSDARGFSKHGAPVGYSFLTGGGVTLFRAAVWREDPSGERVPEDLEPPPGFTDALANGANRHGLIVGLASNPREFVNGLPRRSAAAWIRTPGDGYEVVDLGVPDGFDISAASAVNEPGEVVGTALGQETDDDGNLVQRIAVVVWRHVGRHGCRSAEAIVLPLPADLPTAMNPAVNDAGLIVVQAERSGPPTVSRPLFWKRSRHGYDGPHGLPVPEGFTDAYPTDVNEDGEVLGTAQVRPPTGPATLSQAVVWKARHKDRHAIEVLPNPPDTPIVTSTSINERGDALGIARAPLPGSSGGLLWKRRGKGGCDRDRKHDGEGDR